MEANGPRLYYARKYPSGLNRKWAEASCEIECHFCGSQNCDADISGQNLMMACLECCNFCNVAVKSVMLQTNRGEPYITLPFQFDKR